VKSLSSSHIDSVSQGGNNKTWAITKVFVTIVENGISNLNDKGLAFFIGLNIVNLKLRLPLELFRVIDFLEVKFIDNITRVGVHGNQATNLLTHTLGEITLN